MSILWCGGEDIDFPNGSPATVTTAGAQFRAGYARCAITANAPSATLKSTTFPGGAVSSCWLSYQAGPVGAFSNALGMPGLRLSSVNKGFKIGASALGVLTLFKFDGTTQTSVATESGASFTAALHRLDIQVVNYGASATVNVYLDTILTIAFTGDLSFSGTVTSLDSIWQQSGNQDAPFSEVIVSSTDTRTFALVTLAPAGAGATDQWTGAYTDVNETTINDANVINTNAVTQDEQFTVTAPPSGAFTCSAVRIAARATGTAGATATQVALGVRSGGTVDPGTPQAVTTAWLTYERTMTVNPVTGTAWTLAGLAALQQNFRSS